MNILWFATRSTGNIAMILLTMSVLFGIITAGNWATKRWPKLVNQGLHRSISLLTVVFLAVHIVTVVADSYVPISWVDAFVPFTTPYKTLWVGLGVTAFDLILALSITGMLRSKMNPRAWRLIHWTSYAAWVLAMIHAVTTGTDRGINIAIAIIASVLVIGATWMRFRTPHETRNLTTASERDLVKA